MATYKTIAPILHQYRSFGLSSIIDHDRFNHYAITHHSTSIEGATLTEIETQLLIEEDSTPNGKPLEHSLMVKDHYQALMFILQKAKQHGSLSLDLIRQTNGLLMKSTGKVYHTVLGQVDASKGEFRKGNVSVGPRYFVGYDKVAPMTEQLVKSLCIALSDPNDEKEILDISFMAHFDLVSIHPFYDGNGRTARLLMNYVQALHDMPLAVVFKEDRAEYYESLEGTREEKDNSIFLGFMYGQYEKLLKTEVDKYLAMQRESGRGPSQGNGYSFVF